MKEKIEKFYEKFGIEKQSDIDNEYDGNWETPPIPEGKRLVIKTY